MRRAETKACRAEITTSRKLDKSYVSRKPQNWAESIKKAWKRTAQKVSSCRVQEWHLPCTARSYQDKVWPRLMENVVERMLSWKAECTKWQHQEMQLKSNESYQRVHKHRRCARMLPKKTNTRKTRQSWRFGANVFLHHHGSIRRPGQHPQRIVCGSYYGSGVDRDKV